MVSLNRKNLRYGRHLLVDAARRMEVVERILSERRDRSIRLVDTVVLEILDAVDLPRGPDVQGPFVETLGRGWAGRKAPDCRIVIDAEAFHDLEGVQRADSVLKTWLHESIHGRQPYALGFAEEWRLYRGFEEGLAEGLARAIASELELQPVLAGFNYYVAAYQTLAGALNIPVEVLWRRLWQCRVGEVANGFSTAVADVIVDSGGDSPSSLQRARLFARARNIFGTHNSVQLPDEQLLLKTWHEVLR